MKLLKYIVSAIMIFLIIGIGLNYYISQPIDYPEIKCHKNKLLYRIGDDGFVYLKIKDVFCEYEKGMIIIESN